MTTAELYAHQAILLEKLRARDAGETPKTVRLYLSVELIEPKRRGDCYQWHAPECPVCAQRDGHYHGAGLDPEKVRDDLGGRVPHCASPTFWKRYRNKRNAPTADQEGNSLVHFVLTRNPGLNGQVAE